MLLNNRARDLMENYTAGVAQHFGTTDPGRYFSLNDPQENALRLAMLESVEFLNWITTLDVDQLSPLCGRPCRREPAYRISSLASSYNSSVQKCRSASPRRATG